MTAELESKGDTRWANTLRDRLQALDIWCATFPKKRFVLLLGGLVFYVAFLLWLWLRTTDVLLTADLHTEAVSFKVLNPAQAAFVVDGLRGGSVGAGQRGPCLTGLFTPRKDAIVTYGRVGAGPAEVTVEPPPETGEAAGYANAATGRLDPRDGRASSQFRGIIYFASDTTCPQPVSLQFPIWGDATVGQTPHPAEGPGPLTPSLIIDGSLRISARSIFSKSLYAVTALTIPVGSELGTSKSNNADVLWWGLAYVDPMRTGLVVEVGTEAPVITLKRPNQTFADEVKASGLAQLIDDPDIVLMHIVILVLIALCASAEWLAKFWHEHRQDGQK